MRVIIVLAVCIAAIADASQSSQRIIGGSVTTINQYPFMAAVLFSPNGVTFSQYCGGIVINTRSILTAGHCISGQLPNNVRYRVGSSWANSGGVVHNINYSMTHGLYNPLTLDNDVGILRSLTNITFSNVVAPATIAGSNYNVADNLVVWATGWGAEWYGGPPSEQLRQVQIWTVNQNVCTQRYAPIGRNITANMLCSGWLDVGGRDVCTTDFGGPLYSNGVVIGVSSFGNCGAPFYPGVFVRVSSVSIWIQSNA